MSYLDGLSDEVRAYFKILCPKFPKWLLEYIDTPPLQRLEGVSLSCGSDHTKVFKNRYWYSNLDHSVGVALIVWDFTKDKKQTLAGLFHDISNPTFKHCIDFFNGDHEKQESIEDRTSQMISGSKEIMRLLKRDGIKLEEVEDYKIYPIADNDTPKLSSDRFEYTFASGLVFFRVWELDKIKRCYDNVTVMKNEDGIDELGFRDIEICEEYIRTIARLWPKWVENKDKLTMQFIADSLRVMVDKNLLAIEDFYRLSEKQIVERILSSGDKRLIDGFTKFQNATKVYDSDVLVKNVYCKSLKSKRRYINPLVLVDGRPARIYDVSPVAKKCIDGYLNWDTSRYAYFDFDFDGSYRQMHKRA